MKKFIFILLIVFSNVTMATAQMLTFDFDGWIAAIDELYEAYDQTEKMIKQIEQNYEQMQFYIERAKSFDFKNIEWDGDLDFRDEITNATSQVNRQLNNVRGIRDNFNNANITINGESFSLRSICGMGGDGGNLSELVQAAQSNAKNHFEEAADKFENGVTPEEASFIWSKYGLSPANYYMLQPVKESLNKAISTVLGETEEDLIELNEENNKSYQRIEEIMKMIENQEAGNMTETEIAQVNAMLIEQSVFALKSLETNLQHGMNYTVWKDMYEEQKKQAEEESRLQIQEEMLREKLPNNF